MTKELTSWEHGWNANEAGAMLAHNPNPRWTTEYEGWRDGWLAYQDTIRPDPK